jgi:hypothetical protein
LGSDGGFSIDLGNGRVLWSFGDTLVVKKAGDPRKMAAFVHNTVAIETGYDPSTAQMKYYWRRWGWHMEIFPSDGKVWMWPSHGIRIGNRLVVFCSRIQNNPRKESMGFEGVGSQAFVIENPDAEPAPTGGIAAPARTRPPQSQPTAPGEAARKVSRVDCNAGIGY